MLPTVKSTPSDFVDGELAFDASTVLMRTFDVSMNLSEMEVISQCLLVHFVSRTFDTRVYGLHLAE